MLIGAAGGAGVGIVAAAVTLIAFGFNSAIGVIAATIGVSAALAGTIGGLPATPLAAGIAANLGVFISGALLNLFQTPLKTLLGAGKTVASQSAAADRFLHLGAFIGGLVAAIVAYLYLHRRETGRPWPWYLLAGALPGLLYLIGEAFTRLGGASLFSVVGGFSDDDQAVLDYLSGARIITGLIITFTGGILAMILVGRTLRRPDEPAPAMATDHDEGPGLLRLSTRVLDRPRGSCQEITEFGDVVPLQLVILDRVDGELGVLVTADGPVDHLDRGPHVRLGLRTVYVHRRDLGQVEVRTDPDRAGTQTRDQWARPAARQRPPRSPRAAVAPRCRGSTRRSRPARPA